MTFLVFLKSVGIGIVSVLALSVVARLLIALAEPALALYFKTRERALALQHGVVRVIRPDPETGLHGIAVDAQGHFHNLDTGETFTLLTERHLTPLRMRLDAIQRILVASRGSARPELIDTVLEDSGQLALPTQTLPKSISVFELLQGTPSLDRLVVGATIDKERGTVVPLTRSLHELMHLLSIGLTGAGKSTWLLSFLLQIAMAQERADVMLVDVNGSAFNILSRWDRLRYPIARTKEEASFVLEAFTQETKRRRELFKGVPLAEDLPSYNAQASDEIIPWILVIDEGTILLRQGAIGALIEDGVQGSRQYGMYVFMTGQTAHSSVLHTSMRDQFATRICFNTEATSTRVALGETPPHELESIPGRAWARLRGPGPLVKLQAPFVARAEFARRIAEHSGDPREVFPVIEGEVVTAEEDGWLRDVREAWETITGRKSKSALCRALGLRPSGSTWQRVDAAGRKLNLWN